MAFQPRISTLDGANKFWQRYGISIREDDGIYYATIKGDGNLHAKTLTKMWEKLGDLYVQVPTP